MKLQFAVLCVLVSAAAVAASVRLPEIWVPIKNLKDPHVVKIAEFAVSEYNKQGKSVKFESIEKGESKKAEGNSTYRLLLVVEEGAAKNKYDAMVLEAAPGNFKHLVSFNPHH